MAARRGRSPAAANVTQKSIEAANTALAELPEKPKTHWSLREAISRLQGTINTALERGYSYQEVADMLGNQGIRISPASLKSYLASSSRDTTTTTSKRRRTSTKTATETVPVVEEEASTPEPAPTPKKTRTSRTTSKAAASAPQEKTKAATETPSGRGRRKKSSSSASTTAS